MAEKAEHSTGAARPLDDFLDELALATLLKVSRATVRNWRAKGLPGYKLGVRWWYRESEVAEWFGATMRRAQSEVATARSEA